MKKPDRKAFQREYGPRAAAKYVTAMRKYRKFLKNQPKPKAATPKTEPKTAPKAETPKAAPKAAPKTVAPKPKQTTKAEAKSRFYSSSSGTRGQLRPSNPASPTVTRKGSSTGASVDPRERSLRKNRQDAKRGSTTKGRANIKAQVDAVSGSSKRNQRQVEERRRRARRRAMLKNRRQLIASRNNDM